MPRTPPDETWTPLSDEQIRLLKRFSPEVRERHIEAPHTGEFLAGDTCFIGVLWS